MSTPDRAVSAQTPISYSPNSPTYLEWRLTIPLNGIMVSDGQTSGTTTAQIQNPRAVAGPIAGIVVAESAEFAAGVLP